MAESVRKRAFLRIGAGALLLFVVLRLINTYGDPVTWSSQKTTVYSFLSFMNVSKYPPSLLFCLVTLGVMFLLLSIAENAKSRIAGIADVYGRAPMFYFILHFYIVHFLLIIILFSQGFHWTDLSFASGSFGRPKGVASGISLWGVYLVWIGVVTALYKPCRWFGNHKAMHKSWWLSYI